MFQDKAGFCRINKPKYCWCEKDVRPSVPCHHIRECRYAYGAVEPVTGGSSFFILPHCNCAWMNIFLKHLSEQYLKPGKISSLGRTGCNRVDLLKTKLFEAVDKALASLRELEDACRADLRHRHLMKNEARRYAGIHIPVSAEYSPEGLGLTAKRYPEVTGLDESRFSSGKGHRSSAGRTRTSLWR